MNKKMKSIQKIKVLAAICIVIVLIISPIDTNAENVDDENALNWGNSRRINIFSAYDKNVSDKYDKKSSRIIAPGTDGSYEVFIKNEQGFVIDYSIEITGDNDEKYVIPVFVQIEDQNGKSFTNDKWINISEIGRITQEGRLKKGEIKKYTIYWKWDFERDNPGEAVRDIEDTSLGNKAMEEEIACWMKINVAATGDTEVITNDDQVKTGDTSKNGLLIALMAISLTAFVLLNMKRRFDADADSKDVGLGNTFAKTILQKGRGEKKE